MLQYVVETEKIAQNIRLLFARVDGGRLYAVLKANGYGLGCREMAALCSANGIRHFAVTDLKSAQAVRSANVVVEELLMLSSAALDEIPQLVQLGVTFLVASQQDAENLADYAVSAHVKVDTGMGRRGFYYTDVAAIRALYTDFPNIRFTGICTHFADGSNEKRTKLQFSRFSHVLDHLQRAGIQVGVRHCCSSTSVFLHEQMLLDGVRIGSALLGRIPDGARFGLQHTGMCYAPIESVRALPKGATISYGSCFRTPRPMRIAVCPVGTHYGFGLSNQNGVQDLRSEILECLRRLRNRLTGRSIPYALVDGKPCKVLGCICTEMTLLDVTDVPCHAGQLVQFPINPMLLNDVPVVFR